MTGVGAGQTGAVSPTAGCQKEGEQAMLMRKQSALSSHSSRVSLDCNSSLTPNYTDGVRNFLFPLPDSPGLVRVIKEV